MSLRVIRIENMFPNIVADGYEKHSHPDIAYNCIGFAAGDHRRVWDGFGLGDGSFWPTGATQGVSIVQLVGVFQAEGFEVCPNGNPEGGYEKVVLYADEEYEWTHAARLRPDGWWESKVGEWEDILHKTPRGLEGTEYGQAFVYLKRSLEQCAKVRIKYRSAP